MLAAALAAPEEISETAGTTITGPVTTLPVTEEPLEIGNITGTYLSMTTTTILSGQQHNASNETESDSTTGEKGTITLSANSTTETTVSPTSTSATPTPVNTRPCNGYVEFCARNYSNITVVGAHNSPFDRPGSLASNQYFDVTTQLNDGIRFLQFQTHYLNGTMYLCHTSCDLLNVGPLEDYLRTVADWLRQNPYEVISILIGNFDLVKPTNFTTPVENSGLSKFVYTPPKIPMGLHDWPTLGQMILSGKRAVMFLDYEANQTEVPWLLDEFSHMWETPFSPTDRDFPCTVQRPPGLTYGDSKNRLYMANHNLNLEVTIAGLELLVPNTAILNETNAVSGYGSLGWMADNCTELWHRPPTVLLVDFYNVGNFNGSVFEVAAKMNNVTYNGKCCGSTTSAASGLRPLGMAISFVLTVMAHAVFTLL